jgi:hypothetical protein
MSEEQSTPIFEMALGDRGERLRFSTPMELQTWSLSERSKWEWLGQAQHGQSAFNLYGQLVNQVGEIVARWFQVIERKHSVPPIFDQ